MTDTTSEDPSTKYPASIRVLHWLRAALVLGLIGSGWYMTGLAESETEASALLYPLHKQFGVLVWLLALVQLALRWRHKAHLPRAPLGLKPWEQRLSHGMHRLLAALTVVVPLLGYSLSSSFSQSDGVPFFFISHLPELLPKNDVAFAAFQMLHKYAAYALLACVMLHVAGSLKHRLQDKGGKTDVLPRML